MEAKQEIERLQKKLADGSLPPDEPLFVLRSQDMFADKFVDLWANQAQCAGSPEGMVAEARQLAAKMRGWSPRRIPGRPGSIADA